MLLPYIHRQAASSRFLRMLEVTFGTQKAGKFVSNIVILNNDLLVLNVGWNSEGLADVSVGPLERLIKKSFVSMRAK